MYVIYSLIFNRNMQICFEILFYLIFQNRLKIQHLDSVPQCSNKKISEGDRRRFRKIHNDYREVLTNAGGPGNSATDFYQLVNNSLLPYCIQLRFYFISYH